MDRALNPALARGVLNYLAHNQAHETSRFRDSAPGKIMHETRKGEMAALSELPFGKYYGGVDTTPLFVVLACEYAARTGDHAFITELWPALRAAMDWIESSDNCDADGFLSYERAAATGLANQGWKDSQDSISHADGTLAEGRIALVEVQGYVFAALRGMSRLAIQMGDDPLAEKWAARAERLRQAVETHFWMEEEGFYGLPCTRFQSRAFAVLRPAGAGSRPPRCQRADWRAVPHRLGHPHAGQRGRAIQPDVLPQRQRLAARHGIVCRGHRRLRPARRRGGAARQHVRIRRAI
jgi:glycogen debranching enzyme